MCGKQSLMRQWSICPPWSKVLIKDLLRGVDGAERMMHCVKVYLEIYKLKEEIEGRWCRNKKEGTWSEWDERSFCFVMTHFQLQFTFVDHVPLRFQYIFTQPASWAVESISYNIRLFVVLYVYPQSPSPLNGCPMHLQEWVLVVFIVFSWLFLLFLLCFHGVSWLLTTVAINYIKTTKILSL